MTADRNPVALAIPARAPAGYRSLRRVMGAGRLVDTPIENGLTAVPQAVVA